MKSIKATTIIEGPEEVFISKEANNPTTTDKIPDKIAMIIICLGLLLMFLAIAAGINSKPVIKRAPIILIDKAITPANKRVNIKLENYGYKPKSTIRMETDHIIFLLNNFSKKSIL